MVALSWTEIKHKIRHYQWEKLKEKNLINEKNSEIADDKKWAKQQKKIDWQLR